MKKYRIKFNHKIEAEYTAFVESDTEAAALEKFRKNAFRFVEIRHDTPMNWKDSIEVLETVETK